jgi:dTDP-glucose pyrophosphorylase
VVNVAAQPAISAQRMEITDGNRAYFGRGELHVELIGRGYAIPEHTRR